MNKLNGPVDRIKIGLVIGLLMALTGCAGFGGGDYYSGAVVAQEPDQFLFGGGYDRGRDVKNYSRRGSESRSAVHPVSRGAAHSGGGGRR